jgi:hypothetical protein
MNRIRSLTDIDIIPYLGAALVWAIPVLIVALLVYVTFRHRNKP